MLFDCKYYIVIVNILVCLFSFLFNSRKLSIVYYVNILQSAKLTMLVIITMYYYDNAIIFTYMYVW